MARRLVARERPDHRHVRVVLDHRAQFRLVTRAAELVQDHAGDVRPRLEGLEPEDDRRNASRHAARVDHQHDGRFQHDGERGIAVRSVQVEAVVQALVALDEPEGCALHAPDERRADLVGAAEVRIEVEAGAAGSEREPDRVDVVRALLEGLDDLAAPGERGREPDRDRGLAGGLVRRGDEQALHAACESPAGAALACGRKGRSFSATTVMASASATPPSPSRTSGRLGA